MMKSERWKAVNEDYLISNHGRWFSLKSNQVVKQAPNSSGYLRIGVFMNGRRKHTFTHIKVVEMFGDKFGNRLPDSESLIAHGLSIDHIDKDKSNNKRSNLEIVTHKENCIRRSRKKVNS